MSVALKTHLPTAFRWHLTVQNRERPNLATQLAPALARRRRPEIDLPPVALAAITLPTIAGALAGAPCGLHGIEGDVVGRGVVVAEPVCRRRHHRCQVGPHELAAVLVGHRGGPIRRQPKERLNRLARHRDAAKLPVDPDVDEGASPICPYRVIFHRALLHAYKVCA